MTRSAKRKEHDARKRGVTRYGVGFRVRPPRVTDADLLDKMRVIEGADFPQSNGQADDVLRDEHTNMPVAEAYRQWRRRAMEGDEGIPPDEALSRDYLTRIKINGWHGWHRYFVRGDGSVGFSRGHCRGPEAVKLAEELGFL